MLRGRAQWKKLNVLNVEKVGLSEHSTENDQNLNVQQKRESSEIKCWGDDGRVEKSSGLPPTYHFEWNSNLQLSSYMQVAQ